MRPASPMPFFRSKGFSAPFDKNVLACTAGVQEEIIGSFNFYAEIKELGRELLRANQHPNPAKSFAKFQAYIRQANTFFETAAELHHRASPLNYYYAFMNLAKALVFLRSPSFVDQRLTHGISPNLQPGSLRRQRVNATDVGVFPKFYETATGKKLPKRSSFKIAELLSYVSDVSFEYITLKYGTPSLFRTKFALGVDLTKTIGFPVLAVTGIHMPNFKIIEKKLARSFDEVSVSHQNLKSVFEISAEISPSFRYFEGKQIRLNDPISTVIEDISDYVCANPFNDEFLFTLNCPIRTPKLMAMNEMLAIYIIMFFLGSLVRYRPDLMEDMLSTKDAWILERFIKSAPLTFLRHARNMLDKKYLVFAAR
jgi:hypothetical protein